MRDLNEAAALFSTTHPGRENEALTAALADAQRRGKPITHPTAYFAQWTPEQLAAIQLPPTNAEREAAEERTRARNTCPDCHGSGWAEDNNGNPIRKCTHRNTDNKPNPTPGNPHCTICGKPNLYSPQSIQRGTCASCAINTARRVGS
jgi:hypothetical protein